MAVKTRLSDSALAFIVGYAGILNLYPRLVNPASLIGYYFSQVTDHDVALLALDSAQVHEDAKIAFSRLAEAEAIEAEHQPA